MKKTTSTLTNKIRIALSIRKRPNKYIAEEPLRSELLSSEQMAGLAKSIATQYTLGDMHQPDQLLSRLDDNEKILIKVRDLVVESVKNKKQITPAGEWLIDNFYLVEDHIRNARMHLPMRYSEGLPQIIKDKQYGIPRIYDLVLQVIAHSDGAFELRSLGQFITSFQSVSPLKIGELWAVPIMLRLAIIENLRRISTGIAMDLEHSNTADQWASRLMEKYEQEPRNLILLIAEMAKSEPPLTSAFVCEIFRQLRGRGPDLALTLQWIEQQLTDIGCTVQELENEESQKQAANQVSMSNSIASLRLLGSTDWRAFIESHSIVQKILNGDPGGVFPQMDFETRDTYRHVIENIAKKSTLSEQEIASIALQLATDPKADTPRKQHVGYYLIDKGLPQLKKAASMRESTFERFQNWRKKVAFIEYRIHIFLLTFVLSFSILFKIYSETHTLWHLIASALLIILLSSEFAISIVNFFSTIFVRPRTLPRMNFRDQIPAACKTLVVVPAMLTSKKDIDDLTEALEVRYLANRSENLHFGLLTDFTDADQEHMPEDEILLTHIEQRITELNRKHKNKQRFYLFHRPRHWNAKENIWLGYERKRGKISELNALLRGTGHDRFSSILGDVSIFPSIKYVITIDTDTQLPLEAAWKLIGNMAHPLNQPFFDSTKKRVTEGYGILQPRVAITLPDIRSSTYARMNGNQPGVDPYTKASSDVYQDLFGEGSFIGKGIYDVDVFKQVLENKFPDNQILSHDLLEGCYIRSGLINNVQLFEKYPDTYLTDMKRRSRWVRGDWQILSWIFPKVPAPHGIKNKNPLSALSKWKIFDNIRRSLVPAADVAFLLFAWIFLPSAFYWTLAITIIILFPICITIFWDVMNKSADTPLKHHLRSSFRDTSGTISRTIFSFICLPYEAVVNILSIMHASYRLIISKRKLLEWTTSSEIESRFKNTLAGNYKMMIAEPALGCIVCIILIAYVPEHLLTAIPVLCLWCVAPIVSWWTCIPARDQLATLSDNQNIFLRKTARKTWAYFEQFVVSDDNWLPPDNFQEQPYTGVAHRTSPTNIGLYLLANITAEQFHFISTKQFLFRTECTLRTLQKMKRFKGHFYNWYDTQSLQILQPPYISTVDSGNLIGYIFLLRQFLQAIPEAKLIPPNAFTGLQDTFLVLHDTLETEDRRHCKTFHNTLKKTISEVETHASGSIQNTFIVQKALSEAIHTLQVDGESEAAWWIEKITQQSNQLSDNHALLEPLLLLEKGPHFISTSFYDNNPTLRTLMRSNRAALEYIHALDQTALSASDQSWLQDLTQAIENSDRIAKERMAILHELENISTKLVEVDWNFLYDTNRNLLTIGYNTRDRKMDNSFYDLLASESRLSTFIAIAQGKLPIDSWFALGRMLANIDKHTVLLSWSGSMFEYLMPLLIMPTFENTLLHKTYKAAVTWQIEYGNTSRLPWGISESGYNSLNANSNYQYRAFGVPGLGLKRGLDEDLVVAPYATAMALMIEPKKASTNLEILEHFGMTNRYGYYEALDFTPARLQRGQSNAIVYSHLAHHQGMIMLSLAYVLLEKPMQKLFEAEPQFKSVILLLQERIPAISKYIGYTKGIPDVSLQHEVAETRVIRKPDTAIPHVQLLSNGRYHVMLTNAGSGYSRWNSISVTRWREDVTCDQMGTYLYIRDIKSGSFWSNTFQPARIQGDVYEAAFSQGRADFHSTIRNIETHTEIVVSPEDDIELRRIRITNRSGSKKILDLTSYAEVVLATQASDEMQPAFSNLFVQTEILRDQQAILCTRRPRSETEHPPWMFHLMPVHGKEVLSVSYETDRAKFIGHGKDLASPDAMSVLGELSGTEGAVLDPIVSLRYKVKIDNDQTIALYMITGAARNREECLEKITKYKDKLHKDRVFELAWTHSQVVLRQINASEANAHFYAQLAGSIIFCNPALRPETSVLINNVKDQSGLWAYSISGDLPIVLLKITSQNNLQLVQQLIQAHAYWHLKGLSADLIIWIEVQDTYRQVLKNEIQALIPTNMAEKPGGIFVRTSDHISTEDRILFQSVARIYLSDEKGTLTEMLNRRPSGRMQVPLLVQEKEHQVTESALSLPESLQFYNGYGGFDAEGKSYIISVQTSKNTPVPWVNVLANPNFGSVVSSNGSAYTWIENAHELRLTPWNNDPVRDDSGEAFYIRNESTGHFWSPALLPAGGPSPYIVTHGFGYSKFEHLEDGIYSSMTIFVDLHLHIKYILLKVHNRSKNDGKFSITGYMEWVLGTQRTKTAMHMHTELEAETGALLASIPYNTDFAPRMAFFDVDAHTKTHTCDRTEFIGRNGNLRMPQAMQHVHLSGKTGLKLDPCAAIQVFFDLPVQSEKEMVFRVGAGKDRSETLQLLKTNRTISEAKQALQEVDTFWKKTTGKLQIKTPDAALNLIANGWLTYQTLASRLWARSGFYQSGGAYGFRDQLQDILSLLITDPDLAKEHILLCASRQFLEGDVQHWWHPPFGNGVRTKCSDDYLWLPYATALYVSHTQDMAILDIMIPYLEGRKLGENEESYYERPIQSVKSDSLYQHCIQAIRHGFRNGEHGLPLIGTCDWNDGLDQVGPEGKGESVWLAFFQIEILTQFIQIAETRDDGAFKQECIRHAEGLKESIEQNAWDGSWFKRAWFDDGTPLGSHSSEDCQIDSIAQSWSVISSGTDRKKMHTALESVYTKLVDKQTGIIKLLDPPFDLKGKNPGYIKGYVPGIRENGGQYTHAAVWFIMAYTKMQNRDRTWELLQMINPVNKARKQNIETYKVEPYVVAADVYAGESHAGRGGWTWYTGSASWLNRLITEYVIGIQIKGNSLQIHPCMPRKWESVKVRYLYHDTVYHVHIIHIQATGKNHMQLDQQDVPSDAIRMENDGKEHFVKVSIYINTQ
ncbi:MAG: glucoamylase family protein [Chitinophagales bacterium]